MKHRSILSILLSGLLCCMFAACDSSIAPKLLGSWQIDSVYDFHNGFTYTNREPSPKEVHVYLENKTMLRRGMGQEKTYYYELDGHQLTLRTLPTDAVGNTGEIVELDDNKLVIRKEIKPQFEGKNEVHYELRYFSRVQ